MSPPLLSVIIVCRNPGPRLRDTLASLWTQQPANFEIVIVDGASTDGTREWLESQRTRLGAFVSEPDSGVYAAMNKGVARARGDWVLFLGADDRLASGDVLARTSVILTVTESDVLVGEAIYSDGRIYRFATAGRAIRRNFVHHQATFYRRSLLTGDGKFDETLRIMGDYDLNLRLLKQDTPFAPLAIRVAACSSGGLSDSGAWNGYREEIAARHRYFPAWRCWLWDLGSVVRYLRKKIVRSHARNRPE